MATTIESQFYELFLGSDMSGGSVEFFEANTLTPANVWVDQTKSTAINTVTADTRGVISFYGDNTYRMRAFDSDGVLLYDWPEFRIKPIAEFASETSVSKYSDLDSAILDIDSTETTLVIDEQIPQTGNVTVPSNILLRFTRAGSIDQGVNTLTINGTVDASLFQIFDGTGSVTFGSGSVLEVYPEWFGTSDGTIQLAVTAVGTTGIPVVLNPGSTYTFSNTLEITNIYTHIISSVENSLVRHAGLPGQPPILNYTGTGTGLLVGSDPDNDGVYLEGIRLEGFQLRVTESTTKAMRVWHPLSSKFKNITIFGNSDLDSAGNHIGLETCATQDTSFENIDINGEGISQSAIASTYINKGIFLTTGFGGTVSTTTDYKRVYVRRAITGFDMITDGNFYDCIAEAITTNTMTASSSVPGHTGTWQNFWCESTVNIGQFNGSNILFINGHFDISTSQTFMDSLQGGAKTTFDNCNFVSSHATPLFMDVAQWASSPVQFRQCKFPTNFQIGATEAGGYDDIKITDMDIVIYRFTTNLAAANTTYNCDVINIGSGETEYYIPTSGNVLGYLTHYYGSYTANTYTTTVKYDGVAIADLNVSGLAADDSRKINYLTQPVEEKHYIEVDVTTAVGFATTGGTMVVDVVVALGDDGLA
jgi:hypothetical protein